MSKSMIILVLLSLICGLLITIVTMNDELKRAKASDHHCKKRTWRI